MEELGSMMSVRSENVYFDVPQPFFEATDEYDDLIEVGALGASRRQFEKLKMPF